MFGQLLFPILVGLYDLAIAVPFRPIFYGSFLGVDFLWLARQSLLDFLLTELFPVVSFDVFVYLCFGSLGSWLAYVSVNTWGDMAG